MARGRRVLVLIDGNHRAVRAYQTRQPFLCRRLSDEENRLCILDAPPGVIP